MPPVVRTDLLCSSVSLGGSSNSRSGTRLSRGDVHTGTWRWEELDVEWEELEEGWRLKVAEECLMESEDGAMVEEREEERWEGVAEEEEVEVEVVAVAEW